MGRCSLRSFQPSGCILNTPELASRAHLRLLPPILDQTLKDARLRIADIDAVAVTRGPGLIGALLVGIATAKAIAYARDIPLIGVNHLEGHLWSAEFEHRRLKPPYLALLVSGGHTLLIGVQEFGGYRLLGQTRDDAAGEAFDKVAVLCGIGYPGGAAVGKHAAAGDPCYHTFPVGMRGQRGYDFSFSGLKTAVANFLRRHPEALDDHLNDTLAAFQEAAVESLVEPTLRAMNDWGYTTLVVTGGVAANQRLRRRLTDEAKRIGGDCIFPSLEYCTDNATMIAWVGWKRLLMGEKHGMELGGQANLPLPWLESPKPST
jgi:N6-L-threonylcarbamoyladenine synthase